MANKFVLGLLIGSMLTYFATDIQRNRPIPEEDMRRTKSHLEHVVDSGNGLSKNTTLVRMVNMGEVDYKIAIDFKHYLNNKNSPHPDDLTKNLGEYTTPNDVELTDILENNLELPTGNKERDAQKILDFVHRQIYIPDVDEYTKKPIETLVEGGGDCEDLSVLAYSLMKGAGLDSIYIRIPPQENEEKAHVLIGVAGNFEGAHIKHEGKNYYFAETTGTDWLSKPASLKIGQLPENKWTNVENIEVYQP